MNVEGEQNDGVWIHVFTLTPPEQLIIKTCAKPEPSKQWLG